MPFTTIKITGSILSMLFAATGFAQSTTYISGQGNLQTANIRSIAPVEVIAAQNTYAYSLNDTVNLKSKEISQEINMPKGGEIYIENSSLAIQVKTWDQPKVKIVTTAYLAKESSLTDTECFERIGISLKSLGTSVKIKSNNSVFASSYTYSTNERISLSPVTVMRYSSNSDARYGKVIRYEDLAKEQKRMLTIYVPAGSKMDIETKYSDVQLPAGIGDVLLDITNGNFEAENLNKLRLRSKYSNANMRDIKEAEIEFANGRFSANNIDDLDIESKYATIEMASAKKIKLVSTNDEFEVEDVADLHGRKNYGNLRITRLSGSLELDGSNADIKVRNVGSNVKLIKVDNRYADIRIPLRDTKNYSVNFLGQYSTVYADFEKKEAEVTKADLAILSKKPATRTFNVNETPLKSAQVAGTIQASTIAAAPAPSKSNTLTTTKGTITAITVPLNISGSNTPVKFSAAVGDGKGLKIDLKCQNCTIDFK
ncbi:MAG: hypothetical protein ACOYVG_11865 [Bacteroidota bacterium]